MGRNRNFPSVDDLRSDPMTHRFGDLFNPPGLTNFWGCVQAEIDLTAIRNLNFPPFATGDNPSLGFVIDGRHAQALGIPVTFAWHPDHIERRCRWRDLSMVSRTFLPMGRMAVVVILEITNEGAALETEIGFNVQHRVTRTTDWPTWLPPTESDHDVEVTASEIIASAPSSEAVSVTRCFPDPDTVTRLGARYRLKLASGATWRGVFVQALDPDAARAREVAEELATGAEAEFAKCRSDWNDELEALFTPGNDRYGGHLPTLVTSNESLRKIYWMGALGLAYFRRDSPYSVMGRTYDTLMPRYWQTLTCIWDYFLSAPAHVLLDPDVMRKLLERWMEMDVHKHFGTVYLTGDGIGPWYAINDFAMVSMIYRYLKWTGDLDWLGKSVAGKTVVEHVVDHAGYWEERKQPGGLAGYGDEFNLLECVGTYVHEVVSLNAANVFAMRCAAEILSYVGRTEEAESFRTKASELLEAIQRMYVSGGGYWRARHPDGSLHEVKHAMDLLTVLNTVADDLPSDQIDEIVAFFERELMTDTWMRALSASDDDVLFSVRPDHQWTGAYPAWPPEILKGLCRVGRADLAARWVEGLARSANQGPFGQAHFADRVVPSVNGGAAKAPPVDPHINDWHSSSSGSWVSAVIEGFFGLTVANGHLTATPRLEEIDPDARLENVRFRGELYVVDKEGVRRAG